MSDRGLSVPEAAERLGVSRAAAWRLIYTGELQSVRIGRRRIVPRSVVNQILARAYTQ